MTIDDYQRIFFAHIQKTGGTSINAIFLNIDRKKYDDWNDDLRYLKFINNGKIKIKNKIMVSSVEEIKKNNYFYASSHNSFCTFNFPKDVFIFTCFRDPFKRWLSFYKECYEYKKNNLEHPIRQKTDNLLGKNFLEFTINAKDILKKDMLNQLYMFSLTYDVKEAVQNINKLSYYFFVENFNDGINVLSKKLNLKLDPMHVRKRDLDISYTEDEKNKIIEILKPEYELISLLKQKD